MYHLLKQNSPGDAPPLLTNCGDTDSYNISSSRTLWEMPLHCRQTVGTQTPASSPQAELSGRCLFTGDKLWGHRLLHHFLKQNSLGDAPPLLTNCGDTDSCIISSSRTLWEMSSTADKLWGHRLLYHLLKQNSLGDAPPLLTNCGDTDSVSMSTCEACTVRSLGLVQIRRS